MEEGFGIVQMSGDEAVDGLLSELLTEHFVDLANGVDVELLHSADDIDVHIHGHMLIKHDPNVANRFWWRDLFMADMDHWDAKDSSSSDDQGLYFEFVKL